MKIRNCLKRAFEKRFWNYFDGLEPYRLVYRNGRPIGMKFPHGIVTVMNNGVPDHMWDICRPGLEHFAPKIEATWDLPPRFVRMDE